MPLNHIPRQSQRAVLYNIMEQWTGNNVTVSCDGRISVNYGDYYMDNRYHQNKVLKTNQKHSRRNSYMPQQKPQNNNPRSRCYTGVLHDKTPSTNSNYIFRAKSPSPSNFQKFADMANQFSNSQITLSGARSRTSSQQNLQKNPSRKKYNFNFPSSHKNKFSSHAFHNKQNTINFCSNAKPCTKPKIRTHSNNQNFQLFKNYGATHANFKNTLDEITESIREITLPRDHFIGRNMQLEYQSANHKFQVIKNQILEEIVLNNGSENSQVKLELDQILRELKIAADEILHKYHNNHSRKNSPINPKHYQTEQPLSLPQQPTLKHIFSFNENKANWQHPQPSTTKTTNIITKIPPPQNIKQQSSQSLIKLPEFKDDNKSISSIQSDDPKNQNSIEPLVEIIDADGKKLGEGGKIDNSKYIMIESQYNCGVGDTDRNRENQSMASIKIPTMKPIQLDNSVQSSHYNNRTINESELSMASNKPVMSLADIFKKIQINESVSSIANTHKPTNIINFDQNPKNSKSNQTINNYQSIKPIQSNNKIQQQKSNNNLNNYQSSKNNYQYGNIYMDLPKQEINYNQDMMKNVAVAPPVTIPHNIGTRFIRKQHVVRHLVDNKIVQRQSNSIEYTSYPCM